MVICEVDGRRTFRVYMPEASAVEVVGTFTDWRERPVSMTREDTGWWTATAALPAGDHDFSYLVNGTHWLADYAAMGVKRNGFGGWVSQIHVERADNCSPVRFPARRVGVAA